MLNKLQVFVSSTYLDLVDERQVAIKAIMEAGHIPAGMELFMAGETIKNTIKKCIDESDVYMLILGNRYGSIDKDTLKSYTEWEYDYAINTQKPIFAILLSESYLAEKEKKNSEFVMEKKTLIKYKNFKKKVLNNIVHTVNDLQELNQKIILQLGSYGYDSKFIKKGLLKKEEIVDNDFSETPETLFQKVYFNNLLPEQEPLPELREFVKCQYGIFTKLHDHFRIFLKELNRNIRVSLYNDYIEIENSISFHYYKCKNVEFTHKFFPWLQLGKEMETYQFCNVKYNHDKQKNGMHYICHDEFKPTANPFYYQGGIGVQIPLTDDEEDHIISYISKYKTDNAMFFHSYSFKQFCQSFHIHVQLFDNRTPLFKKKERYVLKWEMFSPYSMDYSFTSEHMIQQKEDIIEFDAIPWMTPSNGYCITLNCKKL